MSDSLGRPILYPCGGETLTVTTTASYLDKVPPEAEYALIYVSNQPIRWSGNATLSATVGMPAPAGDTIDFMTPAFNYVAMLQAVCFIRDASALGDATLSVLYFTAS